MTSTFSSRPAAVQWSDRDRRRPTLALPWWMVGAANIIFFGLTAWLVAAAVYFVFHREITEAASVYYAEKQQAYEDRIAMLRRQIDQINSRQFLDQRSVERELAAVRKRQDVLEQRHLQIANLFDEASRHDLTFQLQAGGKHAAAPQAPLITASISNSGGYNNLSNRPRPADTPEHSGSSPVAEPATNALADAGGSLDRLASMQDRMLDALESTLAATVQRLAAVPEAIGESLPEGLEASESIGGPFVALRGADAPIEAELGQYARITLAIDQLDALKSHVSHLPVRLPLRGQVRMSSRYGSRLDPFLRRPAMHTGVDFRAPTGTEVYSVAAGRVIRAGTLGGYGKLVEIDHGNGYTTRYAHLSSILVSRGQKVEPGELIGKVGSTGRSTGPHLHYETRVKGRPRNPLPYVEAAELLPEGY